MCHNKKSNNVNQNMSTNRPYIASFLASLARIDSPESQLSIGVKFVKCSIRGPVLLHIVIVVHSDAP